jgi:hypothetical protein
VGFVGEAVIGLYEIIGLDGQWRNYCLRRLVCDRYCLRAFFVPLAMGRLVCWRSLVVCGRFGLVGRGWIVCCVQNRPGPLMRLTLRNVESTTVVKVVTEMRRWRRRAEAAARTRCLSGALCWCTQCSGPVTRFPLMCLRGQSGEKRRDIFRRTPDYRATIPHDDRSLQQDGMCGHCCV